jgi:hypothetical protein
MPLHSEYLRLVFVLDLDAGDGKVLPQFTHLGRVALLFLGEEVVAVPRLFPYLALDFNVGEKMKRTPDSRPRKFRIDGVFK